MESPLPRSIVLSGWAVFALVAVAGYAASELQRRRTGGNRAPVVRSRASLWGLALETLSFALVWGFRRAPMGSTLWGWAAAALAMAAVALFAWSVSCLGVHFRIQAVVTGDHRLVTEGPYRLVRHPIYASLLLMLISNALLVARWESALAALALFIAGTEIRVRVEERLLASRMPAAFAAYRARVSAYIPFLR
ncbi:MAG: isoprenylcysteine carboxylmethyltransferase family protein [Bryobacteraceae bacterium]|nr:isoprenylcysteine carboxylmethyltransferase family protein [Bryobacteraceae bacterium]